MIEPIISFGGPNVRPSFLDDSTHIFQFYEQLSLEETSVEQTDIFLPACVATRNQKPIIIFNRENLVVVSHSGRRSRPLVGFGIRSITCLVFSCLLSISYRF